MPETLRIKQFEEAREQEPTWKNVGEQPITGLEHRGNPERKKICEDVKINDPESGLFMVADGVSLASGWFASRELARKVSESLGGELDLEINNIINNKKFDDKKKEKLIDALVRSSIQSTILEADRAIRTEARLNPDIQDAATTASLVKLVEMPDGSRDIFLTNIGDSRIFLMREGKLVRLTEDDSILTELVRSKDITPADARKVDQANSIEEVPDRWKSVFKLRAQITNSVGGHGLKKIDVRRIRVKPGDRLILASDGLTDQLKENEIEYALLEFINPREAERILQQRAEKMSLDGIKPRSKGDDIAVVVYEVGEIGSRRLQPAKETEEKEFTPEQISAWRAAAASLQKEIQIERPQAESLDQQISLKNKEQDLAVYEYWLARTTYQEISKNTPRRFDVGDAVNVGNKETWVVVRYDEKNDRYLIKHPTNSRNMFVDRFTLEPNLKAQAAKKEMSRAFDQINKLKSEIEELAEKKAKNLAK